MSAGPSAELPRGAVDLQIRGPVDGEMLIVTACTVEEAYLGRLSLKAGELIEAVDSSDDDVVIMLTALTYSVLALAESLQNALTASGERDGLSVADAIKDRRR